MAANSNPWGGSSAAGGDGAPKMSKKLSESFVRTKEVTAVGFEKTKVVAAVGFEKTKVAAKKVKEGATVGINWVKLKCNKSKLFQKK